MRAVIESWLIGHWYSSNQPPWYLRALESLYGFAYQRAQKKAAGDQDKYRPSVPLVIVGNLTAGGSGKTPLVIRLCELAAELGLKAGIASTGYGRSGQETVLVNADSDVGACGDEPVLLARRTGLPVVVASDRIHAVKKLCDMDVDLIFSDDGLQSSLHRDLEICVVDGERGLGNGHLLPAGPLRESAERLWTVDHVVTNGEWPTKPGRLEAAVMELQPSFVCSVDQQVEISLQDFVAQQAGMATHAVAAIGHPGRFFQMLEKLGITAETHAFPDHHSFKAADFAAIENGTAIIMTEKDAVKCTGLGLQNAWYIPVVTTLPVKFEHIIRHQLAALTGEDS
jgi:tetraacyldisaccharide 4'-kinase